MPQLENYTFEERLASCLNDGYMVHFKPHANCITVSIWDGNTVARYGMAEVGNPKAAFMRALDDMDHDIGVVATNL